MSMCDVSTYRNYFGACIKVAKEAALCHGWTLGFRPFSLTVVFTLNSLMESSQGGCESLRGAAIDNAWQFQTEHISFA